MGARIPVLSQGLDMNERVEPLERTIERRGLRDKVLESLAARPVALLIAPPVSGKATLIAQLADDLKGTGRPAFETLEGLPKEPGTVLLQLTRSELMDAALAGRIEREIGNGHWFLISANEGLDDTLAGLRLRGAVREFGVKDIALGEDEIPGFLSSDPVRSYSPRLLRVIQDKTEGWIGAWSIIRRLLGEGHTLEDLSMTFSGADRDVRAYFETLILPSLDEEVLFFLLEVGWLGRISAKLAEQLSGRADAARLLEAAREQCLFFESVDRNGSEYRAHPMFGDYLRYIERRDSPKEMQNTQIQAAKWASERLDWISAAHLYSEAGQTDRAVDILGRHAEDLITSRGEVLSFRQLALSLAQEPHLVSSLAPELALGSIFAGDFARASFLLDQLDERADELSEAQKARLDAIRIDVDFGFERFDRVIKAAPRWLESNEDAEPRFRVIVAVALFWSLMAELETTDAYRILGVTRSEIGKANAPFLDAWLALVAAYHKREHGQPSEALAILHETHSEGIVRDTVKALEGAMAWELGQKQLARDQLKRHLTPGTRHAVVETAFAGWEAASAITLMDEGLEPLKEMLEDAETKMASRHGERARRMIRLLRAKRILQALVPSEGKDLEPELQTLNRDTGVLNFSRSFAEMARMQMARYEVVHGDPRKAISVVQPIVSTALKQSRFRVWGEASLIYAGALARLDDSQKAVRQSWQTLERLGVRGMYEIAAQEGALLLPIVDDLQERARLTATNGNQLVADMVMELARRAGRHVSHETAPGDMEEAVGTVRLTPMEHKILHLVTQGHSNATVAEMLVVKLSTVKWHMQNIFAKLHVKSRTAAIAEARRLGLVS